MQVFIPCCLISKAILSKQSFFVLVRSLNPVGLRMVGCCKSTLHPLSLHDCIPNCRYELRPIVTYNNKWPTPSTEYLSTFVNKILAFNFTTSEWKSFHPTGKSISNHQNVL